ncbi:MAG: LysM peptidoglycan-binding domain-containing protein [Anaerolineae bacterium]
MKPKYGTIYILLGLVILIAASLWAQLPARAQSEEGQVYIVQANDTLWSIAQKLLGDGNYFDAIIAATNAKHAEDSSFTLIQDPGLLVAGSKLWIPASISNLAAGTQAQLPITNYQLPISTQSVQSPSSPSPTGHIAFSFWNNAPNRCTYEINVIDAQACSQSSEACQANRRVFVHNNVSEPALSPDGTRLAFRGWGEPPEEDNPFFGCATPITARYLANTTLDGTELRGTGGFWEDSHPDWSPDGKRLLFDTARNGDGITRILLINADGSGEEDLRIAGQQPSWASDNERFVYRGCDMSGNRCGLWLAKALTAKPWETGFNMLGPVLPEAEAAHPDWSPVSDQILYQSPVGGSWDVYAINADGSGQRRLTSEAGIEGLPVWSSDGQWLAYLSDVGGNWGIWVMRADGTERRQLFSYDGGTYTLPAIAEPYNVRDWLDEQISWSK